jgi:hypothetical protein
LYGCNRLLSIPRFASQLHIRQYAQDGTQPLPGNRMVINN